MNLEAVETLKMNFMEVTKIENMNYSKDYARLRELLDQGVQVHIRWGKKEIRLGVMYTNELMEQAPGHEYRIIDVSGRDRNIAYNDSVLHFFEEECSVIGLEFIDPKADHWIYPDLRDESTWPGQTGDTENFLVWYAYPVGSEPQLSLAMWANYSDLYKCHFMPEGGDYSIDVTEVLCWRPAPTFPGYKEEDNKPLTRCMVGRDAECNHPQCPVSEQDIKAGKYCTLPVNDWRE